MIPEMFLSSCWGIEIELRLDILQFNHLLWITVNKNKT